MTIFTGTNEKRIEKITEIVALLQKSATANQAESDDIWKLLQPAVDAMSALLSAQPPDTKDDAPEAPDASPEPVSTSSPTISPRWRDVQIMAQKASLPELQAAMLIYMDRLDAHFSKEPKS